MPRKHAATTRGRSKSGEGHRKKEKTEQNASMVDEGPSFQEPTSQQQPQGASHGFMYQAPPVPPEVARSIAATTAKNWLEEHKDKDEASYADLIDKVSEEYKATQTAVVAETPWAGWTKDDVQKASDSILRYSRMLAPSEPLGTSTEYLQRSYECLDNHINTLISTFLWHPVPWENLRPQHQEKLKHWTPKARQFMMTHPTVMFRAWIWHLLDDFVFSADPSVKWQGDESGPWKAFGQFMSTLKRKLEAGVPP